MDWDKILQLSGALTQFGGSMSPNPNDFSARVAPAAADMVQSELMRREMEKQEEEAKKAKKGKLASTIGSTLGTIAGTMIPGIGNVAGAALGSALGGAAGNVATGNPIDMQSMMLQAALGGTTSYLGNQLAGMKAVSALPEGAGEATKALERGIVTKTPAQQAAQGLTSGGARNVAKQSLKRYAVPDLMMQSGLDNTPLDKLLFLMMLNGGAMPGGVLP